MEVVGSEKHVKYWFYNEINIFANVRTNRKTMQKRMPKVGILDPFWIMGLPRVDLLCFCYRFGAMPPKYVFFIGTKSSNNQENWPKSRRKDARTAGGFTARTGLGGPGLVSGHARDKA